MTTRNRRSCVALALALGLGILPLQADPLAAQGKGRLKTDSRITYHDGEVFWGQPNVYFIFYGCWEEFRTTPCEGRGNERSTSTLLSQLVFDLSGSPYMRINATYSDYTGVAPKSGLVLGPRMNDLYSHTSILSDADVEDIVLDALLGNQLPWDPAGIYLVVASADVAIPDLCLRRTELHGDFTYTGNLVRYGFIGNPWRCPLAYAPQFVLPDGRWLPTPNDDFAADAMATAIAHVLSGILTNPGGTAWFDRYGLESSDKCHGSFGHTYVAPNGAEANFSAGGRHWLIQQNWVNDRKGYCAMSIP